MKSWIAGFLMSLSVGVGAGMGAAWAEEVYQAPDAFVTESFGGAPPSARVLWLTGKVRDRVREMIGREPPLRMRYWARGTRTVWILEEIGKVKPITAGFVVEGHALARMRVLIYRESHGWEVRYPFFTDQFKGLTLAADDDLSEQVDGISGATLSVNALRRMARLALYLDSQSPETQSDD